MMFRSLAKIRQFFRRLIKLHIFDTGQHEVNSERGRSLASRYGIQYYETSAKDGIGVNEAFADLAMLCYQVWTT